MMNRITTLFVTVVANTFISPTAFAEADTANKKMAAECRQLAEPGKLPPLAVRLCISSCDSVNAIKKSNTKKAALKQCENAHAKVIKHNITSTPEQGQRQDRSPRATKKTPQRSEEMADIEGVYLQTTRSGFRVRAEGRKGWQTYCNEAARLVTQSDEFSRTVKAYDRVRLTGISYNPDRAKAPVTRCMAKSAVILSRGGK